MKYSMYGIITGLMLMIACGGSKEDPVNPPAKEISAPTGLTNPSVEKTTLTLQWNAVSGASSYAWQLLQAGTMVREGTTTTRNVSIANLTAGTAYRFGVAAVSSEGTKSAYSWLEVSTLEDGGSGGIKVKLADFDIPASENDKVARAFPGAEGGGMYVTGGRGGKVYHVTNLNDSGTGSLRYGIEKGERPLTIVFDVAGVIALNKELKVENGNLTIAGQTAPGDGICLKNYNFRIHANNVIVRFMRFRMGDEKKNVDDALNMYSNANDLSGVIIDHCSMSWSTDECGTFYGMNDFTLQWCILSESLLNSIHGKGKHGYGGIWGGTNATYHHNLLAHHYSRNPRLDHDYVSTLKGPVTLANNVIYNWGDNSTYGGESANDNNDFKKYNIINNYYKPGPATVSGKYRFIDPWTGACSNCSTRMGTNTIVPGHFYMNGNVFSTNDDWSADNWKGTTASASVIAVIKSASAFANSKSSSMTLHTADNAYQRVLSYAGASLKRDSVDDRVTKETKNGNYTYHGSNGGDKGFIDTQTDVQESTWVNGWPAYNATDAQKAAVKDTDGDGIPDVVEDEWGLDKNNASDGAAKTIDTDGRYSNFELYLHYLVKAIVNGGNNGGTYTAQ